MLDGRDGNPRVADGVTGTMGTPSMKVSVTKLRDAKERNMQINVTRVFAALAALALIFVAVLPVRVSAAGSHGLPIDTPAEAHEAVLETGAPFGDFAFLGDGLIGASQYYEVKGEPGSAASWIVIYTYGWGDCPAGCISRHTFVYQVDPVTGEVRFDRQEGEALPAEAPEALNQLEASGGAPVVITPIDATVPAASDAPATEDPDWAAMYEQWYEDFVAGLEPCAPDADPADPALMTCLLLDGSVAGPMPLFAPAPGPMDGGESGADDGWISELPKIILAVLLVWIGGAALVGWRKSRAS
jgi:hypothetical protein